MTVCCNCEKAAPEVDLRYGDCCVDCLAFDCDRCGESIPVDEELRLVASDGNCDEVVCEGCLQDSDRVDA
jgi:hypothetical protein